MSVARARSVLGLALVAAAALGFFAWRRGNASAPPAETEQVAPPSNAAGPRLADEREPTDAAPARESIEPANEAAAFESPSTSVVSPPDVPANRSLLRGRVVDARGAGLADAAVEVEAIELRAGGTTPSIAERFERALRTEADGGFELDVPERRALIARASTPGHAPAFASPVFGGEVLTLVLLDAGELEIVVRDGAGAPIEGAKVRAWNRDAQGATAWSSAARTDAAGFARIGDAPRARIALLASDPPRADARRNVDLSGEAKVRVELALADGLALRGSVAAAADGAPIEGARVGCDALGFAATDARGRFELAGIAPTMSAWGIGALHAGFAPTYLYVQIDGESGDRVLDFRLERAPALTGTVVDAGAHPVPGAEVLAAGRQPTKAFTGENSQVSTATDANGRFRIDPVHPRSRWTLRVRGPSGGEALVEAGPFAEGVEEIDLGEIALREAASIRGRIEGAGDPTALRVALRPNERDANRLRPPIALALPDPWGAFRFDRIVPGRYFVELRSADGDDEESARAVVEVELDAGELEELVLTAGRARIEGRVIDPAGRPAKRSALVVEALDGSGRVVAHAGLDRDASFALALPDAGEYTVVVLDRTLRYETEHVEGVRADGAPLRLRLHERTGGARIAGRLLRADGQPVSDVTVSFRNAESFEPLGRVAVPDASGAFEIRGLEEVPYFVEVVDFEGRYVEPPARVVQPHDDAIEIVLEARS